MEELKYFPAQLLGAIPFVISILKIWVPVLWREALAAVIAAAATAFVIIRTPLTLGDGIIEGIALFFLLVGTRTGVTGIVNVVQARMKGVPMYTTKGKVIRAAQRTGALALLAGGVAYLMLTSQSWADSTATVIPVVEEVVKEPKLWVIIVTQVIAKVIDWFISRH